MSRFGERLRKGWRGAQSQARVVLAGVALFLLAFLLGIHLFFPAAAMQHWLSGEIAARAQLTVPLEKMSLKPFFTFSGRGIALALGGSGEHSVVLDELRLQPFWTSLISADPGISVQAALQQGRLDATLRRSGGMSLHTTGMKLTDFPVHPATRTLLSGTIVKGDLQGSFPARPGSQARLSMEIDNCAMTVLGQPLRLGKIALEGSGPGNSLRITTLSASGGDLVVAGTGNLLFGPSLAASRLNLDLTLRPVPSAPPTVATLLDLASKRQADNSYRLKLNGALSQLAVEQSAPAQEPSVRRQSEETDD